MAKRTRTAPANDNHSWNCGVEGPADDPAIRALRARQKRNFVTTLLLSQGVPILYGGDELSHSQKGNNNAYCQDNDTTWLNWQLDEEGQAFLDFVKKVTRLWRTQPVLQRRRRFFQGRAIRAGSDVKDISLAGYVRPGNAGRRLEREPQRLPRGPPGRRPDRRDGRTRRTDHRRNAAHAAQLSRIKMFPSPCRLPRSNIIGSASWTRPSPTGKRCSLPRRRSIRCKDVRWS